MTNKSASTGYNVVFRNIDEGSVYFGAITWTTYKSKMDFDEMRHTHVERGQEIVAEGVTNERAVELARSTPYATYMNVLWLRVVGYWNSMPDDSPIPECSL